MSKTTISFYPNVDKKSKKTSNIPIYIRVLHNSKKAEARLNCEVEPEKLSLWNPRIMRFDQSNNSINNRLNSINNDFVRFEAGNNYKIKSYTVRDIIDILLGSDTQKNNSSAPKNLKEFIVFYYETQVSPNASLCEGTKKNYKKARNHLFNYLDLNNMVKIKVSDFDFMKAQGFKTYLMSNYAKIDKKAMTEVSASSVITKLKAIFEYACDADMIPKNPFKKVKLSTQSPPRPKLTGQEVAMIYHLDLSSLPAGIEVYRDIFLFSCFTGLSFSDAINLTKDKIGSCEYGKKITSHRSKTTKPISQILVKWAEHIINKYCSSAEARIGNTILPRRSLTHVNLNIKALGVAAGINKKISTHTARHSFRQMMGEAGIQDSLIISSIMGWGTGGNINATYCDVTDAMLNQAKEKFELYLNKFIV